MILRLFKYLYPEVFEYKEWFYTQRNKVSQLEEENRKLTKNIKRLEMMIASLEKISKDEDLTFLKPISDKNGALYYLRIKEPIKSSSELDLEVFDSLNEGKRIGLMYVKKRRGIAKIQNFKVMNEDSGIGSSMMNELVKYLNRNNHIAKQVEFAILFKDNIVIETIQGELSKVDWGHIDKLIHFYSKFGFEVSTNNNKKEGSIAKQMPIP